jgi:hypothetical protein
MTREVFYKKVGRKYVPISEYDSEFVDSIRYGTHLSISSPGGHSVRYNIEPDFAAMIAAGHYAEDAISRAIMKAQDMRPQQGKELTPEEREAWNNFVEVMGDRGRYIEIPSAREATEAGVKAMMLAAKDMFESHPSVKQAYEHLITMACLAKKS